MNKLLRNGKGIEEKLLILAGEKVISPWHHIPINTERENVINMVSTIKRHGKEVKFVDLKLEHNPIVNEIVTDRTKGNIKRKRLLGLPTLCNYGMAPETWQSPKLADRNTYLLGDNYPVQICEIGDRFYDPGSVVRVRVLGAFCMATEETMSWKLVTMNEEDSDFLKISNILDFEEKFEYRSIKQMLRWFSEAPLYEGRKQLQFAYNAKVFPPSKAMDVIKIMKEAYHELLELKIRDPPPFWLP